MYSRSLCDGDEIFYARLYCWVTLWVNVLPVTEEILRRSPNL